MSLVLQHQWEHALIAATVENASAKHTVALGRTAIQKLLYFMHVLGVPMRYTFDIHHFGPFCQEVMSDVEWLMADEVIVDVSTEERCSNYTTGDGWTELAERFREKLSEYDHIVKDVCEAMGDMSPRTLELIATLDFAFRWVKARGGDGPWRSAAIEKFKQIKDRKFADAEIADWYDTLVDAKLIQN